MDVNFTTPVDFDDIEERKLSEVSYATVSQVLPNGRWDQLEGGCLKIDEMNLPADMPMRERLGVLRNEVEDLIRGHLPPGRTIAYMIRIRSAKGGKVLLTTTARAERQGRIVEDEGQIAPDADSRILKENDALLSVPALRALFFGQTRNVEITAETFEYAYRSMKRVFDIRDIVYEKDTKRMEAEIEGLREQLRSEAELHERERTQWAEERDRLNKNLVELIDVNGQSTNESGELRAQRMVEKMKGLLVPLAPYARQAGIPIPPGMTAAAPPTDGGPFDAVLATLMADLKPEQLANLNAEHLLQRLQDPAARAIILSTLGLA